RDLSAVWIDEIDFGQHDDRARNVEKIENVEMLERLLFGSFWRCDDEKQQLHARGTGEHVMQEALVTGNVNDAGFDTVREAQRRKAEIECHASLLLFDEPIGIVAGQCDDERTLAVIDVPGCSDYVHVNRLFARMNSRD
ncbi:MAG TPA: hypothetical protein VGZ01_06850, partial [Trinickia sp.]|nr:hypothetical protein [Trinickia sp.]